MLSDTKLQTRAKITYDWLPNNINNLLDIGCASGYFTVYFKDKAKDVYGVDINKDLINEAKNKYKGINFKLLKSKKLPFRSNFFDVVTILDVLEHVNDDKIMINEIHRVLKKDGLLILSVPNKGLLTFLDADNIKITIPEAYKILYYFVRGKFPEIKKGIHKHYSIEEVKELIRNKFKINKIHIGSSIISTLVSYFEVLSLRIFNKRYFDSFLTMIKNVDYSVNYRRFGDNIILRANKINL